MRLKDFLLLVAVCVVWGFNFVVAKFAVTGSPGWVPGFDGVPPIFFAFLRFALLYAFLAPWLRPRPTDIKTMIGVALCMGALQYVLLFMGMRWATPSGMAIAVQMGVPFATILSVIFLKETVGLPRILGMTLAFAGVMLVIVHPGETDMSLGMLLGIGAAFVASLGMILVKRLPMDSIRMQAWIGLISWPPLLLLSLTFEHDQMAGVVSGGWAFGLALMVTVVLVNIFGHGVFYNLLQRYDATLIAPITLLAPLVGVVSGILLTGDPMGWRLFVGGGLTLVGVGIIALRQNKKLPAAALAREKTL
ncbi:DMT family transporter [Maricaulis maris]|jgi:O-acetylserine/cysteine efflux transporter|uniref:DMT family transporter n=1 Tax=Maricaulis maris TaxID=74318 RepID=UPI0029240B93|nr:O-acetylserine/cysteine exporter [Maricaulis maris]